VPLFRDTLLAHTKTEWAGNFSVSDLQMYITSIFLQLCGLSVLIVYGHVGW